MAKRPASRKRTTPKKGTARKKGDNPKKLDPPSWNPDKQAVWSRRWIDPLDSAPTTLLLHHPSAPFTAVLNDLDDLTLQSLAFSYLERAIELDIVPPLELPDEWLQALDTKKRNLRLASAFGWLPIQWPPASFKDESTPADPLVSFRAERFSPDGTVLPDRTIILMASERLQDRPLGSEFGLRVVMHADERTTKTDNGFNVRITGLSASLPFGEYIKRGVFSEDWTKVDPRLFIESLLTTPDSNVARTLSLDDVKVRGLRIARDHENNWKVERRGTGRFKSPLGDDAATKHRHVRDYPCSFVAVETVTAEGKSLNSPISTRKTGLFADAIPGDAQLFPIDPASRGGPKDYRKRRPSRSEAVLEKFCSSVKLGSASHVSLQLGNPEVMRVTVAPRFVLADHGATPGDPKAVDLSGVGPEVQSDDFAAVSAFRNVKDFFDRLDAYGLGVNPYFRVAKLPLRVAYRSGVEPGPGKDGQVVNARVIPDGWPTDIAGPVTLGQRPGLEMHLALANLRHRDRKSWDRKDRSPAEPIGIASDARWIWHELGHVALMASVGELEFRFAHSAGDALAAISMDPHSDLASNPTSRGLTFPWVFIPRRHDRCVGHGWSWGGTMHSAAARAPYITPHPRKAYLSEQILSSSLFRLYCCLGGDTRKFGSTDADKHFRRRASHYAIYLILRAMQIVGTSGIVVGNNPEDFVSALVDADIGTHAWNVTYPAVGGETFKRVGGSACKVIRWAFEAQGLYTPTGVITNAPGLPPPVDVYIADGRPLVDSTPGSGIDYGPGNYLPVSLEWDRNQKGGDLPPAWQAPSAIDVQGNQIRVKVGNRGSQSAAAVKVSVWYREWPKNTPPPTWQNGAGWTSCSPAVSGGQSIAAGGETTFGPFTHAPPPKRYIVIAMATCTSDPANIDPATGYPCSFLETELIDLVASDNNLALRVLKHN
jgi:hypothetical protein